MVTPGTYRIRNVQSGTILDLGKQQWVYVIGWEQNDRDNQLWYVQREGDKMLLKNCAAGNYASVYNHHKGVKVHGCSNPLPWELIDSGSGYFIGTPGQNRVMELDQGLRKNGTPIFVRQRTGAQHQKWHFEKINDDSGQGGGYYPPPQGSPPPNYTPSENKPPKPSQGPAVSPPPGQSSASPPIQSAVYNAAGKGYISAGDQGSTVSKYTFQWAWKNPKSGISTPLTFNINSDVPVPSFHSQGAPIENKLEVKYDPSLGKPNGLSSFTGSIGDGRVFVEIPRWKIVVQGPIMGGPAPGAGADFVGNGSWIG